MAGTNGIKIMLFHHFQIFENLSAVDGGTCQRVKIMAVHAAKLYLLSV